MIPERLIQLDDGQGPKTREKIAALFQKFGCTVVLTAQSLPVEDKEA